MVMKARKTEHLYSEENARRLVIAFLLAKGVDLSLLLEQREALVMVLASLAESETPDSIEFNDPRFYDQVDSQEDDEQNRDSNPRSHSTHLKNLFEKAQEDSSKRVITRTQLRQKLCFLEAKIALCRSWLYEQEVEASSLEQAYRVEKEAITAAARRQGRPSEFPSDHLSPALQQIRMALKELESEVEISSPTLIKWSESLFSGQEHRLFFSRNSSWRDGAKGISFHHPIYFAPLLSRMGLTIQASQFCKAFGFDEYSACIRPCLEFLTEVEDGLSLGLTNNTKGIRKTVKSSSPLDIIEEKGGEGAVEDQIAAETANHLELLCDQLHPLQRASMFLKPDRVSDFSSSAWGGSGIAGQFWDSLAELVVNSGKEVEVAEFLLRNSPSRPVPFFILPNWILAQKPREDEPRYIRLLEIALRLITGNPAGSEEANTRYCVHILAVISAEIKREQAIAVKEGTKLNLNITVAQSAAFTAAGAAGLGGLGSNSPNKTFSLLGGGKAISPVQGGSKEHAFLSRLQEEVFPFIQKLVNESHPSSKAIDTTSHRQAVVFVKRKLGDLMRTG